MTLRSIKKKKIQMLFAYCIILRSDQRINLILFQKYDRSHLMLKPRGF